MRNGTLTNEKYKFLINRFRMITSTMRIEFYYSSVREELLTLFNDNLTLLDR